MARFPVKDLKTTQSGIDLIKNFEGFSAKPYLCPAKVLTIGYGHVIKPWETFKVITKEKAEELLKKDIQWAEKTVQKYVTSKLTQNEFNALVSFVFNVGSSAFKKSTLLKAVNSHISDIISTQFLRWVYVQGEKSQGLVNRRIAEKALYFS